MRLYELTDAVKLAAESLEAALAWEPEINSEGQFTDGFGNIITAQEVEAFRADLSEAWEGTLEGAQLAFEDKIGNIGAYIKDLKAEIDDLKAAEASFKKRRAVKEKALERMSEYVIRELLEAGIKKVDVVQAAVSLRDNPESTIIDDEKAFIRWAEDDAPELLKYKAEINKTAVKQELHSGKELPLCRLERRKSLTIK